MKLIDTIELMKSEDYKERFLAEYLQLKIRIEGLRTMLVKYRNNELSFTPKCSYELLYLQMLNMESYLKLLKQRAEIEGIPLDVEER